MANTLLWHVAWMVLDHCPYFNEPEHYMLKSWTPSPKLFSQAGTSVGFERITNYKQTEDNDE